VFENGDRDMVMVSGSFKEADKRRHINRGAVLCDKDVGSAAEVEDYRKQLTQKYVKELGIDDITILFTIVG